MNKIYFIISILLFHFTHAQASQVVFTTIAQTDQIVFAGVKKSLKGHEPDYYLLKVTADSQQGEKINLPTELAHREIISIHETDKKNLIVLTQRTIEQGDEPTVHHFDAQKKNWKKITQIPCQSFSKITVEKDSLMVSCLEADKAGNEKVKPVKITLQEIKLVPKGLIELPLTTVKNDKVEASLLGDSFEWSQLKVIWNKKEKIFTP